MADGVDAQGTIIGVGILLAALVMFLGPFFGNEIAGVEAMTVAAWIFALTFGVLAVLHVKYGLLDVAGAHSLAAVGWVLVLLGRSGFEVALGLVFLVAGGAYIARVMLAGEPAASGEAVPE